jgi:hypothetical protein
MTEAEWLACPEPFEMLRSLGGALDDRKARLFACACTRRVWHLLVCPASCEAVEAAEAYADGLFGAGELTPHYQRSNDVRERLSSACGLADRLASGQAVEGEGRGVDFEQERAVAARGVTYASAAYEAAMAAHDCTDCFSPVNLGEYTARAVRYAVSRAQAWSGNRFSPP